MIRNQEQREQSALGRFEIMCELYINGSDEMREVILSRLDESEKETFLQGCCLYHIFTDDTFRKKAQAALGEQLYKDFNN